jgi:hypothetical protein
VIDPLLADLVEGAREPLLLDPPLNRAGTGTPSGTEQGEDLPELPETQGRFSKLVSAKFHCQGNAGVLNSRDQALENERHSFHLFLLNFVVKKRPAKILGGGNWGWVE